MNNKEWKDFLREAEAKATSLMAIQNSNRWKHFGGRKKKK